VGSSSTCKVPLRSIRAPLIDILLDWAKLKLFLPPENKNIEYFPAGSISDSPFDRFLYQGGKGGGKPESAQASGTNYEKVDEIVLLASKFAQSKLS